MHDDALANDFHLQDGYEARQAADRLHTQAPGFREDAPATRATSTSDGRSRAESGSPCLIDLTDELHKLPALDAQQQQMQEVRALHQQRWRQQCQNGITSGAAAPPQPAPSDSKPASAAAPAHTAPPPSRGRGSQPSHGQGQGSGAAAAGARGVSAPALAGPPPVPTFHGSQRPQPGLKPVPPRVSQPCDSKLQALRAMTRAQALSQPPLHVIPELQRCLLAQPANSFQQAFLCGHVEAFSQANEPDQKFGCGFRNVQVMASHLMAQGPAYRNALFAGQGIPDVPSLQQWLEHAWRDGFDVEGAAQLGWHVHGTDTWIGSTDAAAMLRFTGVNALLYDIHSTPPAANQTAQPQAPRASSASQSTSGAHAPQGPALWAQLGHEVRPQGSNVPPSSGSRSAHPRVQLPPGPSEAARKLFAWIRLYFELAASSPPAAAPSNVHTLESGPTKVVLSGAPPVFVQHQGHSRTIIGIVRRRKTRSPAPAANGSGSRQPRGAGGDPGGRGGRGGRASPRGGGGRHGRGRREAGGGRGRGDRKVTEFFTGACAKAGAKESEPVSQQPSFADAAAHCDAAPHEHEVIVVDDDDEDVRSEEWERMDGGYDDASSPAAEEDDVVVLEVKAASKRIKQDWSEGGSAWGVSDDMQDCLHRNDGSTHVTAGVSCEDKLVASDSGNWPACDGHVMSGDEGWALPPLRAGGGGLPFAGESSEGGRVCGQSSPSDTPDVQFDTSGNAPSSGAAASEALLELGHAVHPSSTVECSGVCTEMQTDSHTTELGGSPPAEPIHRARGGAMKRARAGGATGTVCQGPSVSDDDWEDVLLVLDSQTSTTKLANALTSQKGWRPLLERGSHTWRRPCYQIMTVAGLLPAEARSRSKKLLSQRF